MSHHFQPRYCLFRTSIGIMGVAWSSAGIVRLQLPERSEKETRTRLSERFLIGAIQPNESGLILYPVPSNFTDADVNHGLVGYHISDEGSTTAKIPAPVGILARGRFDDVTFTIEREQSSTYAITCRLKNAAVKNKFSAWPENAVITARLRSQLHFEPTASDDNTFGRKARGKLNLMGGKWNESDNSFSALGLAGQANITRVEYNGNLVIFTDNQDIRCVVPNLKFGEEFDLRDLAKKLVASEASVVTCWKNGQPGKNPSSFGQWAFGIKVEGLGGEIFGPYYRN